MVQFLANMGSDIQVAIMPYAGTSSICPSSRGRGMDEDVFALTTLESLRYCYWYRIWHYCAPDVGAILAKTAPWGRTSLSAET